MNINYEEIISKANERAEKLKAFVVQLEPLEQKALELVHALKYFTELAGSVAALDVEGRALLPLKLTERVTTVGGRTKDLWRGLTEFPTANNYSLEGLLSEVESSAD